ncbi:16054_t:CDS:1, partial [Dentiscutata erythropus]
FVQQHAQHSQQLKMNNPGQSTHPRYHMNNMVNMANMQGGQGMIPNSQTVIRKRNMADNSTINVQQA